MTIKKKLGLGIASAALGVSLIGGGTFAAFNDVENLANDIETGTLDLELATGEDGVEKTFNLENLKPGDSFSRSFEMVNNGSLAIKDVWLAVSQSGFENGANEFVDEHEQDDNNALQFLDQFKVEILRTAAESESDSVELIRSEDNITLRDLVEGNVDALEGVEVDEDGSRIDLAPSSADSSEYDGIPADPDDYDVVEFKISMIDNPAKVKDKESAAYNEYYQNRYQGDSIDLNFEFEATQWNGIEIDKNGYVKENEYANPGSDDEVEVISTDEESDSEVTSE